MALYNAINVSFPIKFSGKRQGKKGMYGHWGQFS